MNMCQKHWDLLRDAIDARGMSALIPDTAELAARNMVQQLEGERRTIDNYDPLMSAFWSIGNNGMNFIRDVGGDPLAIMMDTDDLPFEKCTICYLNWIVQQHHEVCTKPDCPSPKSYEWMIDRAADDQVEVWKSLGDNE
jgi:hypothetical protein